MLLTCSFNFKSRCWNSGLVSLTGMPSYLNRLIHSVFQKPKSIGDWLAGCRNALPAIVCHAILRLKNAVENQLLMVPLDVRVAGRWYLGVIRKLRNALGGVGHVLHFVTWGEAMPVLRNGPVVRQFLALHAFHTCAMHAPHARLTRACFVHHF